MTFLDVLLLFLVAGVCGGIGRVVGGFRGPWGCWVSVAVGFVGAFVGLWLASILGLPALFVVDVGGAPFPVVWAIVGAALFVAVLGTLRRR